MTCFLSTETKRGSWPSLPPFSCLAILFFRIFPRGILSYFPSPFTQKYNYGEVEAKRASACAQFSTEIKFCSLEIYFLYINNNNNNFYKFLAPGRNEMETEQLLRRGLSVLASRHCLAILVFLASSQHVAGGWLPFLIRGNPTIEIHIRRIKARIGCS